MATTNRTRPRVRPIPIAEFCDRLKTKYKRTSHNKYVNSRLHVRRIEAFLKQHPSAKTTADITGALIEDYKKTLGNMNEKNRDIALTYFRLFCNLAVEWDCLRRNPFDEYPLPKRQPPPLETEPRGEPLDANQLKILFAYLKAEAVTWNDLRFNMLVSIVANTGIGPAEALELKFPDWQDGKIRRKQGKWARRKPIPIGPGLKRDLDAWLLIRKFKERDPSGDPPYGKKLADDGKTRIADEAQQAVIVDMRRWRNEGWSFQRIADELNARGIPTKYGKAEWQFASVRMILRKTGQADSDKSVATGEGHAGERDESDDGPDYLFPNVSGTGHWSGGTGTGRTALEKLRRAGEAVGIKGVTFPSLMRFYSENVLSVLGVDLGPVSAGQDSPPPLPTEPIDQAKPISQAGPLASVNCPRQPIPWRGTQEQLDQEIDAIESRACRDVVRKLIELMPDRPTKQKLEKESDHGDAVNHLRNVAESGTRLGRAIGLPGRGKRGYWIEIIGSQST